MFCLWRKQLFGTLPSFAIETTNLNKETYGFTWGYAPELFTPTLNCDTVSVLAHWQPLSNFLRCQVLCWRLRHLVSPHCIYLRPCVYSEIVCEPSDVTDFRGICLKWPPNYVTSRNSVSKKFIHPITSLLRPYELRRRVLCHVNKPVRHYFDECAIIPSNRNLLP